MDSETGQAEGAEPLLVMGEIDGSAPLAAIYRTRYGRTLEGSDAEVADEDVGTDEEAVLAAITTTLEEPLSLGEALTEETPAVIGSDVLDLLEAAIPVGANPAWVNRALHGVADRQAQRNRTSAHGSWFVDVFGADFFRTRPARIGATARAEAEFTSQVLQLGRQGRSLLDVGGGYGRISVPIAQGGTNVTLLDLSSDMIDMAVSLGTGRKVELESLHMDMRDLSIEAEYDCARCGGGTFGYFSDAENLITLSRMAHAVKLGGRVLIDVLNRDRVIQDLPNRGWWEGDGCLIQEDADFDLMTSRLEVKRLLVFSDGTQREALISIRLYSIHELGQMMEFVGLRPLDVTGAPQTEGTFFVTQSQRLMVTGERVR